MLPGFAWGEQTILMAVESSGPRKRILTALFNL